mmetsp:Transcript_7144/g.15469  ORF Transcript_7144/g.15469 Transcript_7144/m.15469 type:complete len:882 (-) Transcript_7144:192-2837(-)
MMIVPALLLLTSFVRVSARSQILLDEGWRFYTVGSPQAACTDADFPDDLSGQQCLGLVSQAQVTDEGWCQATCCGDPACEVWQWCPGGSAGCGDESCWTGKKNPCVPRPGWKGQGRTVAPTPEPSPGQLCETDFCKVDFEDSGWHLVDLPHDMLLENNFSSHGDKAHGYLLYSKGWYRLHFHVPKTAKGQALWLDFDGIQRDSVVYLNGKTLGTHLSGYTPFRFTISDVAIYGSENILAVSVDATRPDGWWYDGGGIYRHVWLNIANPVHLVPWGVYLPALVTGPISGLTADATISAQATVVNAGTQEVKISIKMVIVDAMGAAVARRESSQRVLRAGGQETFSIEIVVKGGQLWSHNRPHLYRCEASVVKAGVALDAVDITFGIRRIQWDKDRGLLLNDQPVKVKGFANHQDFAGVGVAVPDSLQGFRVHMHKMMGANAWRTAHNPPTTALLDECDRAGMLVWDENHRNLATPDMIEDLRAMVLRDRNHPSVIMWSLCNEALCEGFDATAAAELKAIVKSLDPKGQRPVTAAMNRLVSEFEDVLDVIGINYHIESYDDVHASHPNQAMIGSETSSDFSDRSVYENDPKQGYVSAYDVNYPSWGSTAEDSWCAIEQRDFIAGGFYWTGFDYKGEPTPYGWPNINSHFGVIDIAGFPKDNYGYHQSVFFSPTEQPVLHLLPHWNWNGTAQRTIDVWAYTNCDSVELYLNNKSLGKQTINRCRHVHWQVDFEAGELRAEATLNSRPFATRRVATTGPAVALELLLDWPLNGTLTADSSSSALVAVRLVDAVGRLVPTASMPVRFTLSGPGRIIGLGNGDPSSHEHDKPELPSRGTRSAWNGLARVVVQATKRPGTIVLHAEADELRGAEISIASKGTIEVIMV